MKKFLLLVGLLCFASLAWAGFGYQFQMALSAPTAFCATQSAYVTQSSNNAVFSVYDVQAVAQEFTTLGAGVSVYSIKVYINRIDLDSGESGTLNLRIGTGADLSSSYLSETSITISYGDATGEKELVFASPVALSASTKYYFGMSWEYITDDKLLFDYQNTDVYSGNAFRYDAGNWNFSNVDASRDLKFVVVTCD